VVSGSPADSAGLKAGDEVRNFGYVNHTNHEGLRRVGECVQSNEGVSSHRLSLSKVLTTSQRDVLVKISRSSNGRRLELQLNLQPRRDWGGRGLLGCHILPL
jgi:26S proteasome non-ATPase regulatory subunit 9